MIKIYIKRFITIISLIAIPLSVCFFTQNYTDSDSQRLTGFYQEEKNSLDMVIIGASDVYNAYSPALAYKEYGYTSYPFAFGSDNLYLFKSQINEVIKNQSPSLIVVDLNSSISLDRSFYDTIHDTDNTDFDIVLRRYTDNIPLSDNKIKTISKFGFNEDVLSYYFPFIMHHGSFNCIPSTIEKYAQISRSFTYLKGVNASNHQMESAQLYDIDNNFQEEPIFADDEIELRSFLEYCNGLDCKVLFTKIPHRIVNDDKYKRFLKGNYLKSVVESYGFDYLNFDHYFSEIGLDVNTDFADDGHLNALGQRKFTVYFGKIVDDKYLVNRIHQSPNNADRWERCVAYTDEFYKYYDEASKEVALNETQDLIKILSNRLDN